MKLNSNYKWAKGSGASADNNRKAAALRNAQYAWNGIQIIGAENEREPQADAVQRVDVATPQVVDEQTPCYVVEIAPPVQEQVQQIEDTYVGSEVEDDEDDDVEEYIAPQEDLYEIEQPPKQPVDEMEPYIIAARQINSSKSTGISNNYAIERTDRMLDEKMDSIVKDGGGLVPVKEMGRTPSRGFSFFEKIMLLLLLIVAFAIVNLFVLAILREGAFIVITPLFVFVAVKLIIKIFGRSYWRKRVDNILYAYDDRIGTLSALESTGCSDNVTVLSKVGKKKITAISAGLFLKNEAIRSVTLEHGHTRIATYAFCNCISLQSINMPYTVKRIESYAFASCISLGEVDVPEGVEVIDSSAFRYCSSLYRIILPSSLKMIGESVFRACTRLFSITIPKGVKFIGANAFKGCDKLEHIHYDGTVEEWRAIEKARDGLKDSFNFVVECTDGKANYFGD